MSWHSWILNIPVIPDIPEFPTISDISIINQISSRLWFQKGMTLYVCSEIPEILNIPDIPEILNIHHPGIDLIFSENLIYIYT